MKPMRVSTMNTITGVLAIIAAVVAVLLIAARLINSASTRRLLDRIVPIRLWLAFLVAGAATAGSLWYSESADFEPCRFCWFQRIFMYSLAVILLIAALRKDHKVTWYAVPLGGIGLLISVYHNLLEHNPHWESTSCQASTPCATPYFKQWGWLTLAGMALAGFAAILAILLSTARSAASAPIDLARIDRAVIDTTLDEEVR